MTETLELLSIYSLLIGCITLYLLYKLWRRLQLSRAKHPSLRGHSRWSRRISKQLPYFSYGDIGFYCSDHAPNEIIRQRKNAFERLKSEFRKKIPNSIELTAELEHSVSDIHFTQMYRVPFPYREQINELVKASSFAVETQGVKIRDIDNNWNFDLTGSYGVNVFGYDFYKSCMTEAWEMVRDLGPVLGTYHPLIKDNVERLKNISGLDIIPVNPIWSDFAGPIMDGGTGYNPALAISVTPTMCTPSAI